MAGILISCSSIGLSNNEKRNWSADAAANRSYKNFIRKETIKLFPDVDASKSPKLTFSLNILDIENAELRNLLNKTIYNGNDCKRYAADLFEATKNKYYNSRPSLRNNNYPVIENSGGFNWEYIETGSGALYKNILVIERHRYIYTGGAHGSNETEYFVFDTSTMKKIRLNDIIQPNSLTEFKKNAESELKIKYAANNNIKLQSDTTLSSLGFFENTVELPVENFLIAPDGIGFAWNPYEIAPYSFGIIKVILPYKNINKLLNNKGKAIADDMQKLKKGG
ncbi:MAG: RsiV family protein [Spirochaetaceae bacterium]|jgi:hypothetical protein|nr:RsiV family protein [Spirochaetaceae bacterium]